MSGIHLSEFVVAFTMPYCWRLARCSRLGKAGKTSWYDAVEPCLKESFVIQLNLASPGKFNVYRTFYSFSSNITIVVIVFRPWQAVHTDDE